MQSKMKFKDWTCDPCKYLRKEGQTAQTVSNSSQSVHTVKAGAPNASAPSSSAAAKTSNSNQRGWHTCTECQQPQRTEDFNLEKSRKIPDSGRCEDCESPACHSCGLHQRPPKRIEDWKPVPVKEQIESPDGTRVWYCEKRTCQARRPRTCDVCFQHKDMQMFKND